eukprot:scaffold254914_cov41-Tisochrysis_lutea.AAC.4
MQRQEGTGFLATQRSYDARFFAVHTTSSSVSSAYPLCAHFRSNANVLGDAVALGAGNRHRWRGPVRAASYLVSLSRGSIVACFSRLGSSRHETENICDDSRPLCTPLDDRTGQLGLHEHAIDEVRRIVTFGTDYTVAVLKGQGSPGLDVELTDALLDDVGSVHSGYASSNHGCATPSDTAKKSEKKKQHDQTNNKAE